MELSHNVDTECTMNVHQMYTFNVNKLTLHAGYYQSDILVYDHVIPLEPKFLCWCVERRGKLDR